MNSFGSKNTLIEDAVTISTLSLILYFSSKVSTAELPSSFQLELLIYP